MLQLEFPNETHKNMYEDLIGEWSQEADFHNTSPGALFQGKNFEEFLQNTKDLISGKIPGKTPSSLFLLIDGDQILGGIDIRHNIESPYLCNFGGHIGYGIRPSQRGKGYATKMLKGGLEKAREIGIEKVLISCYPDNIGSEKVILKNGGVYDATVENEKGRYKRYWITL